MTEGHPVPPPELIDAHCHVDLFPDPNALADEAGCSRIHIIAVTNAPSVFLHTLALSRDRPYVHAAVGLHPEVAASHGHELERMWPLLEQTKYVGEIGLDYVTDDQSL